jgi:hypothetical protein
VSFSDEERADPGSATRARLHAAKEQHEATLETPVVDFVGQELIFSVDRSWLRMSVQDA